MTVILCSVASFSPGVVLHAGCYGTFPEIHVNSSVCWYDRRAAAWRCGRSKLSASWSCDVRLPWNGTREYGCARFFYTRHENQFLLRSKA